MALPEDLAPALTDGVVLCHLANHIKPRSVASIHVPSPAVVSTTVILKTCNLNCNYFQPKLTMARCRRNVDNFLEACRRIGVDEVRLLINIAVNSLLFSIKILAQFCQRLIGNQFTISFCKLMHIVTNIFWGSFTGCHLTILVYSFKLRLFLCQSILKLLISIFVLNV